MMKTMPIGLLLMLLTGSGLLIRAASRPETSALQDQARQEHAAQSTPPSHTVTEQAKFRLRDGTPVKLRLKRTVTSVDAQVGDRVDFEVIEPIKVGGVEVISKGAAGWGTVGVVGCRGRLGKGGKLVVNIEGARLVTGENVTLTAVNRVQTSARGTALGTTAMLAPLTPAVPPLMLLMHGDDVVIPKGTRVTAYVNGDVDLDGKKFAPNPENEMKTPPALTPQ